MAYLLACVSLACVSLACVSLACVSLACVSLACVSEALFGKKKKNTRLFLINIRIFFSESFHFGRLTFVAVAVQLAGRGIVRHSSLVLQQFNISVVTTP